MSQRESRMAPVQLIGPLRPNRRLGDEHDRRDDRDGDQAERNPEEPVVVQMLENRAGEDDPEPRTDPEQT